MELSGRSYLRQRTTQQYLRSARLVSLLSQSEAIEKMFMLGLLMTAVSDHKFWILEE